MRYGLLMNIAEGSKLVVDKLYLLEVCGGGVNFRLCEERILVRRLLLSLVVMKCSSVYLLSVINLIFKSAFIQFYLGMRAQKK